MLSVIIAQTLTTPFIPITSQFPALFRIVVGMAVIVSAIILVLQRDDMRAAILLVVSILIVLAVVVALLTAITSTPITMPTA